MSRYRAPAPRSSTYVTRAGFERLNAELDALWPRRRDVVAALSAAAAEGDRSENAEYQYRKRELAGIDRRIRYLQKRLPSLDVVDAFAGGDTVRFGATVEVELEDATTDPGRTTLAPSAAAEPGTVRRLHIVGADEIDPASERVSVDSPLARALLGRRVDDSVSVEVDGRTMTWCVLAIDWPAPEA